MEQRDFTVKNDTKGMRIDMALVKLNPDLSRRKIRSIIDAGGVYLNSHRVRIASRETAAHDKIRLVFDLKLMAQRKSEPIVFEPDHIIFEDEDLIVINKMPGLSSQATQDQSVEHAAPIVEKFLRKRDGAAPKLILVHRLDKETSGLLILAKNSEVATRLTDDFRERKIKKEYHAVCLGISIRPKFHSEQHLSAISSKTGMVSMVRCGGKLASSDFEVIARSPKHRLTLVRCLPSTGRSHQLRVQLMIEGLPILGDKKYSTPKSIDRLSPEVAALGQTHHLLHAFQLRFTHPRTKKELALRAPYPNEFRKSLELFPANELISFKKA